MSENMENNNHQQIIDSIDVAAETVSETVEEAAQEVQKKNVGREVLSWILTIAVAVCAALLIRTFIFEPVRVDGHSMCDTLQDREIMVVTKPEYLFGDPQHGDIVICNYPDRVSKGLFGIETKTKFVKRVMGVPGDTLEIINGVVYRNGEMVEENYLNPDRNKRGISMTKITLKEDEYFVMGDNRDNSNDSRYIGPITRDMIIGHVRFVVFPFGNMRTPE